MSVSVLITCHNYADLVLDAIKSVEGHQTFIIDDASEDDSFEMIRDVCGTGMLYRIEQKMGPAWCKNFLIEQAWDSTEVFFFLDADDIYLSGKIEKSLDILKEEKMKIGLVYTDEIVECSGLELINFREPFAMERMNEYDIVGGNFCVTKQALQDAGRFNPSFPVAENYDLAKRIADQRPLVHIPEPLVRTRFTERSLKQVVPFEDWKFFESKVHGKT